MRAIWILSLSFTSFAQDDSCFTVDKHEACPEWAGVSLNGALLSEFFQTRITDAASFNQFFDAEVNKLNERIQMESGCKTKLPTQFMKTYYCDIVYDNGSRGCGGDHKRICRSTCETFEQSVIEAMKDEQNCPNQNQTKRLEQKIKRNTESIMQMRCRRRSDSDCVKGETNELATCGYSDQDRICNQCATSTAATCPLKAQQQEEEEEGGMNVTGIVFGVIGSLAVIVLLGVGYVHWQKGIQKQRDAAEASNLSGGGNGAMNAGKMIPTTVNAAVMGGGMKPSEKVAEDQKRPLSPVGQPMTEAAYGNDVSDGRKSPTTPQDPNQYGQPIYGQTPGFSPVGPPAYPQYQQFPPVGQQVPYQPYFDPNHQIQPQMPNQYYDPNQCYSPTHGAYDPNQPAYNANQQQYQMNQQVYNSPHQQVTSPQAVPQVSAPPMNYDQAHYHAYGAQQPADAYGGQGNNVEGQAQQNHAPARDPATRT